MKIWVGSSLAVVVAALLLVLASPVLHAEDRTPIVFDARIQADADETRLEIDMTGEAEATSFVLASPDRLIIDLPEVGFALDRDVHGRGAGLLSTYRYGVLARGRSRIVADLTGPARIVSRSAEMIEGGRRMTLVLEAVDRDAVLKRVSARPIPRPIRAAARSDRAESAIASPGAARGDEKPVIVIDPGHGGIDSGAASRSGALEKNVVLAFARALADALREGGRYEPVLTRDDDRFIPLAERVAFAREKGAMLFVSIHADAVKESYVRGATLYTLSERASDARAAALADKENRVDMLAGLEMSDEDAEVADILIDLARRETKNFSILAARAFVSRMRGATRLNKNPMRSAGFKVLRAPDVPSVLLELGYLSNAEDAAELSDAAWRVKTAKRVAEAVDAYFGADGASPTSASVRP